MTNKDEPNEADGQAYASGARSRGAGVRQILVKSTEPNLAGLSPDTVRAVIMANSSAAIRLKTKSQH